MSYREICSASEQMEVLPYHTRNNCKHRSASDSPCNRFSRGPSGALYCSFKAALVSKSEDRQDDPDIFHGRKFESHKRAKNFKGGLCLHPCCVTWLLFWGVLLSCKRYSEYTARASSCICVLPSFGLFITLKVFMKRLMLAGMNLQSLVSSVHCQVACGQLKAFP